MSLEINFGPERKQFVENVAWHEGMTVEHLLRAASESQQGIEFKQIGSGASAFLTDINGVSNEGAGGRNWTYQVNGKHADRSFAVYELRPGDRVLWNFAAPK